MGRSQETFNKKQREKNRNLKKKEKLERKAGPYLLRLLSILAWREAAVPEEAAASARAPAPAPAPASATMDARRTRP